jgi:glycosyltransferase involved in cell wall biosynthesis
MGDSAGPGSDSAVSVPTASVIIATHDHAAYLPEAIESVLNQTLVAREVIVVDDGSTDETPAVLAGYGRRIRWISQPNRGLAAARNAGLAIAEGSCIGFLDADDLYAPSKLAEQVALLDAHGGIGWTFCDVHMREEATGTAIRASERFAYHGRNMDGWLFPELIRGNCIPAIAPLIRRSALDAAGGFDERLTAMEDWDLWLRLSRIAEGRYLPRVLATYRMQPAGMSRDRSRMDRSRFEALDKIVRTDPAALRALGGRGRRIMADTHNWFGYAAHARGDWPEACRRLSASVRSWPWQRRAPILLVHSLARWSVACSRQ